jgi:hypothetical protein
MTSTTTTPTTTTTPANPAVDRFLARVCGEPAGGPDPFAPDALLDAVVPGWRLQVHGAGAIGRQLRDWYRDPGTLDELRRQPTPAGEIVELTVTWTEDGVPHAARQVHVLDLDAQGRIARDRMWCGGRWSADLLAEMDGAGGAG